MYWVAIDPLGTKLRHLYLQKIFYHATSLQHKVGLAFWYYPMMIIYHFPTLFYYFLPIS